MPTCWGARFEGSPQIPRLKPPLCCTPGCLLPLPPPHKLLNLDAEHQKWLCNREKQASVSRSPLDTAMTYVDAAAVPTTHSGHTATHRATRKITPQLSRGTLGSFPLASSHPAAHNTCTSRTAGWRCQTRLPLLHLFPSIAATQEPTPQTTGFHQRRALKPQNNSLSRVLRFPRMRWGPTTLQQLHSRTFSEKMEGIHAHPR